MEDYEKIEQRIQQMKDIHNRIGDMIDDLPDIIPEGIKTKLKNDILNDKELKNFMAEIEAHRPPRIFLIGRTGVGKSSFINALCGSYVAAVSHTKSCTEGAKSYKCMNGNHVKLEVLDTRGIAESESLDETISAEEMLMNQINEFSPDVAILLLNCTHRDDVDSDAAFLQKVAASYREVNKMSLPVLVVINKCDEMAPSRIKEPNAYPQNKVANINEVVQYYKEIITKSELEVDEKNIIAVSSLIDWQTSDGEEVSVDRINMLSKREIESLEIAFDGRFNIAELEEMIIDSVQDYEAKMGMRLLGRIDEVMKNLAKRLTKVFAGISATVALTPIPVSDIYILVIIQSFLVYLIASFSGQEVSLDSAKDFILRTGGIAGAGYVFRLGAQQASKFLNMIFPGAGSTASAGVAYAGTVAIGEAAIAYYLGN